MTMNTFSQYLLVISTLLAVGFCETSIDTCNSDTNTIYNEERQRGQSVMWTPMELTPNEPFLTPSKTIILNQKDPNIAREQILKYFHDSYDLFTSLHDVVKPEHFWDRGDPLRHPIGWYMGHCAVFYINKLRLAGIVKTPINGHFESLFAVGVDEMSWDDKLEDRDNWPPRNDVYKYRQQIRDFVTNTIQTLPLELPIRWESAWWAIIMAIEHDRIHLETSSLLLRQLPIEVFNRPLPYIWGNECTAGIFSNSTDFEPKLGVLGHSVRNQLLPVKDVTNMEYGRDINDYNTPGGNIFGWDNEYGTAIIRDTPSFNASKYLVSNEEFYEFILDGGYKNSQFWTDEGWRWVQTTNTNYPKFWRKIDNKWKYRTMLNIIDLPWNWPVITNQLEANAFTKWKSFKTGKNIRLPTEDEYYSIRKGVGLEKGCKVCEEDLQDWKGPNQGMDTPGNIGLDYFTSEAPVDMFEFGSTGFYDIIGNVWQHTITPLHVLEGFNVHPYYDDYTYPFVDDLHTMMKGGSWMSSGSWGSKNTRNWFRRHFFQVAGIRYVESDRDLSFLSDLENSGGNVDDEIINKHTHLHYCDEPYFGVPNFAKQVADIAIKHMNTSMKSKALDIGCGTGRTTYELAKVFDHVTGLDCTTRLIGVGYRLAEQGFLEWDVKHHGEIKERYRTTLRQLGLEKNIVNKVYFAQEDAQNIPEIYNNYDLIVASNLIDQLANPLLFLTSIHERINSYGKLVLLSPYVWEEDKTLQELWIGGKYINNNEAINTFDALQNVLNKWFILENDEEVEMVQRETNRTFKHSMVHCTVWKRK